MLFSQLNVTKCLDRCSPFAIVYFLQPHSDRCQAAMSKCTDISFTALLCWLL